MSKNSGTVEAFPRTSQQRQTVSQSTDSIAPRSTEEVNNENLLEGNPEETTHLNNDSEEVPAELGNHTNLQNNQNVQQKVPAFTPNEKLAPLAYVDKDIPIYEITVQSHERIMHVSDVRETASSEEPNNQDDVGRGDVPPSIVDSHESDTVTTLEERCVLDIADSDDAKETMPSETPPTSNGPTVQNFGDGSNNTPSEVPAGQNVETKDETRVCDVSEGTISEGQVEPSYRDATDVEDGLVSPVAVTDCTTASSALVMSKGHVSLTNMKDPEIVLSDHMSIRQQLQSSVSGGGESCQIVIEKNPSCCGDSFYYILELCGPQPSSSEIVTLPFSFVPR